ncbi:MAG: hypothetical protein IJS56_01705 [Bacilli bacterium]|nr:hypothetical protein [Bacilli bacterium]
MKVNSMDEERISISKIKNIVSIGFSDLALARIENAGTEFNDRLVDDGNTLVKPMLTVCYDGTNIICLSSDDKNFNYLVQKTREVYLKEKDKIIEGSILKRKILIDDNSKRILLSDTALQTNNLYKKYSNMEFFNESLISGDHELKALLPLIEYIIKSNLRNIDCSFNLEDGIHGYSPLGNYTLYGKKNGIYISIPIKIERLNNSYNISIGNVFGELKPLNVHINFNKTSLDIISNSEEFNYFTFENFEYNNGFLVNNKDIYVNKKSVYTNSIISKDGNSQPSISKLDKEDILDWFRLPWGASIGFKIETKPIDDLSSITYREIEYVDTYKDDLIDINSAEKRFKRKTKELKTVRDLIFDDVDKRIVAFKDSGLVYLETTFGENNVGGEYNENYANKYFYQVSSSDVFNLINKDNTYPVMRDYDVFEPGDLKGNYKIRKKVMGN